MQEFKTDIVINKMTKAQYDELLASDSVSDTELYYIIDDNDKYYLKSETYSKAEVDLLLGNSGGGGGNISLDNYYTKTETNTLVDGRISSLINAAPEAYDTLKEISDYIESDLSNTASMLASIANKANSADVYTKSEANAKFATLEDIPEEVDMTQYYTKDETLGVIDKITGLDNYYDKTEIDTKVTNLSSSKQDKLVSGNSIKTINGESILGAGNIAVAASGGGGTTVVANPELNGTETKLRGITIASENYSVMASEMAFSDVPVESELKLANIQIGNDNWSLVSEISVNQKVSDAITESKGYTDEKLAALINSAPETLDTLGEISTILQENDSMIDTLNSAVGSKANAADVYTKEEANEAFMPSSDLDANPITDYTSPRLTSLRVKGVDYQVLPDAAMTFSGEVDNSGNKTLTQITCNSEIWNLPSVIYFGDEEPENPVLGMIWLKPVE